MNAHSGTMSPVSVDGSDWSGINQYQKSDPPFSPTFSTRSNLATPPTSGVPSGSSGAGLPTGAAGPVSDSGNPSPPSSVAARSSDGTLGDQRSKRQKRIEEVLGQHYVALRRFLHASYRDDKGNNKSNKARDKLLRLSSTQFHELSTDVYDELLRRQQAMPSSNRPPRPDVPPFLPPRKDFHEKRNQARQKLASLQHQRFRDLATDVYTELERRFPHFPSRESRRLSPAPSYRGRPSNGYPPNGYPPTPGGPRSQSRGPPSRMGYHPSGGSPASPMYPPRQGSLGGPPPGMNGDGGPMAKSFHSNTIVPNKSTMVEDDDDAAGTEDDYDARSDAFALDAVLQSRRGTGATLADADRKALAETQSQVSVLQDKVNKLEDLLKSKDEEISKYQEDQNKVEALEELVKSKEEELLKYQEDQDKSEVSSAERQEWEALKSDLESKISQAEDLNSSLQHELDKVRADHEAVEMDLRNQLGEVSRQSTGDPELEARFAELEIKHQALQTELQEQQQVTEEVRHEAAGFLREMRALSEQSQSRWEHEEQLTTEVHKLEDQVKQWKTRYEKAKAQLQHLRTSSIGTAEIRPDTFSISKDREFFHEDGLVKDVHVAKFQVAIDELLHIARNDDYHIVTRQINAVVIAVRHVLHDVQECQDPSDGLSALRTKAISKLSATANNLITAAKNFVSSNGLSPVSLLDAAASHLSTAVIELIRLVKIRSTPAEDPHDDDDDAQFTQMKSPDYFSVAPSQSRHSRNDSVYSAMSPPPDAPNGVPAAMQSYPSQSETHELQEMKLYVEDQTNGLVQSIQALIDSIRADRGLTTINTHVSAICSVVTNVTSSTQHFVKRPESNPALRQRIDPIIEMLEYHKHRLMGAAAEGDTSNSPEQLRDVTNKLPPIAFEIPRVTKELAHQLNPANFEEDDDFR
ncbi:putative cell polarity protein [Aspergillus sclerotioniger CBS 115572]|uniref:Putative cell polarity protein n=1 Tax=Aspergillus sclerotioniger CBS 115572 TaxID=1450535 RepID=A0A317VXR6_9EURO|nr:putative cell polarity protein [Aspergillus sclerotioniger CBS 115572]PWY78585.1 putative cell polarity protein [Aspergillus sclerotioniger CBS 115572]